MTDQGTPGENRNGLNPIELVTKASFAVGLTRLSNSGNVGGSDRGKSSWDTDYDKVDFFKLVLAGVFRIEIEEQLDSYFRTAKVYISDRQTLLSLLPLTGNEIITIRYKNALIVDDSNTEGLSPKILHFSISNITNSTNTLDGIEKGSRIFILNLVEAPAFSLLTNKSIYQTFSIASGKKGDSTHPIRSLTYSDIMESALLGGDKKQNPQKLLDKWYDIEIEESLKREECKVDFYIPNWTISKTLNYVKMFSVNKNNYPFYIFYITPPEKEGLKAKIHLKSLYTLFENKDFHIFSQNFVPESYRPTIGKTEKFDDYENDQQGFNPLNVYFDIKINYFNIIQTAFYGLSGETFAIFDYIEDNKYIAYDYYTFVENHKGLGDVSLHAFDYGNQWSNLRPHSYIEPQRLVNKKRNEFAKNQLQSALSCAIHCTINHNRQIGQMIDIPIRAALHDSFEDRTFSGKWLIWGQRDVMTLNNSYSICHVVKEGFSQETNNVVKYGDILNKFSSNLNKREIQEI